MRSTTSLNKDKIVKSFSRSAATYDEHAGVQKLIGEKLVGLVTSLNILPEKILDIGTGTGDIAFLLSDLFKARKVHACDIAPGMIEKAKAKAKEKGYGTKITFDVADCESLPYADGSFDLIVSNLMFQWVDDLERAFSEVRRVLKTGGYFIFSTFGRGTLKELRESYLRSFGMEGHLHQFMGANDIARMLAAAGLKVEKYSSAEHKEFYGSPEGLFDTIKKIGAVNSSAALPRGLRSRAKMARLIEHYRKNFSNGLNVYATYEAMYFASRR